MSLSNLIESKALRFADENAATRRFAVAASGLLVIRDCSPFELLFVWPLLLKFIAGRPR